jgi:hypothetical protein
VNDVRSGHRYAVGALALGSALVIGFALHNTSEGVAIVAPLVARSTSPLRLLGLETIAGGPAIVVPARDLVERDASRLLKCREERRDRDLVVVQRSLPRADEQVGGSNGAGSGVGRQARTSACRARAPIRTPASATSMPERSGNPLMSRAEWEPPAAWTTGEPGSGRRRAPSRSAPPPGPPPLRQATPDAGT